LGGGGGDSSTWREAGRGKESPFKPPPAPPPPSRSFTVGWSPGGGNPVALVFPVGEQRRETRLGAVPLPGTTPRVRVALCRLFKGGDPAVGWVLWAGSDGGGRD
jgi:hypothetical protein